MGCCGGKPAGSISGSSATTVAPAGYVPPLRVKNQRAVEQADAMAAALAAPALPETPVDTVR
jgi:hypothetical protein